MINKRIVKCQAHRNIQLFTYINRLLRDAHNDEAYVHKVARNDDRIAFETHY